jgi:hypothetical protein
MKRPLTTLDLRAKKATRDLHKAVGGVDDAGKITEKSHAMHGYYQSRNRSDSITIADVLRLEAVAVRSPDYPQITRLLCENAGGIFVELPDVDADDTDLMRHVMKIADKFGVLARDYGDAMADGLLEHHEIILLRRDLRVLMEEALACDERLKVLDAQTADGPAETNAQRPP